MLEVKGYWKNYIDGAWVDGGAGKIDVINPGTGEKLAEQALADATDVDLAVQAAKRVHATGVLSDMRPVERGRMVQAMGKYLLDHLEEIATLLSLEQGKPVWEARAEVTGAARYFEYYGNQAETLEGRSIPLGAGYFDFTTDEPYGVSAQIIPWNFPVEMTARSLSAALTTGNTVVVKPPEMTPLSNAWFAYAAEAVGLPEGAVNLVCGYGHEAGAALSAHPDINQVVFTGSVATGIAIASAAAKNVVPCVLELGGKSAAIVHSDADLEAMETDIRKGIFINAGQVCSAMSRIIVHESRHDELVQRAVSIAESLSEAVSQGAKLATGGRAMNIPGAFLQPTVLTEVTPEMTIAQTEVFGPVLSVLRFREDAEAIEIANGTDYGLVGGVFTRDLDRATQVARKIRAGQVFVNEWFAGGVETPFGGYGKSGYGREKGREALWNYVQTKNIAIKLKRT